MQDSSWEGLAEAKLEDTPPELPTDTPPDKVAFIGEPPKGHCYTCGEFIERAPGSRGKQKYHPECRPTAATKREPSYGVRMSALERAIEKEADIAVEAFRGLLVKAAMMLSMVDRYSAFCILVSTPDICANLRGVCLRYDGLRRELLAIQTGGSILGLLVAVAMCVLPILAHHGILPGQKIRQVLVQAPYTLHAIHQRMEQGESGLATLMQEQLRENMKDKARANTRPQYAEPR